MKWFFVFTACLVQPSGELVCQTQVDFEHPYISKETCVAHGNEVLEQFKKLQIGLVTKNPGCGTITTL